MPERILVPLDGSDPSWDAFEFALSEYASPAEFVVLHVINPMEGAYGADAMGGDYWEGWYENAEARAERLFEEARDRAGDRGDALESVYEMGSPAHTIIDYSDEHDIDHIVIGSHGRTGVSRILLGSVAESVVRRAAMPVTVVR